MELTGSQNVTYNPNNPLASVPPVGGVTFSLPTTGGGQLSDPTKTSTINAVEFLMPAFYQSSPGGVEDFIYSGDPNNLTYNTPSGVRQFGNLHAGSAGRRFRHDHRQHLRGVPP